MWVKCSCCEMSREDAVHYLKELRIDLSPFLAVATGV
jgi:hypothetical protein